MTRYDTSKTSPDYSPPPRGLGTWTWIAGIIVIAAVILGVFLWNNLGGQQTLPQSTTPTAPVPTAAR